MKKDITELYCFIEDFCRIADEKLSEKLLLSGKKSTRIPKITVSKILYFTTNRRAKISSFFT